MAAPKEATVHNLTGRWTMDSSLSDSTDPTLQLQGISWFTRKAIGLATITLHIKEYTEEDIVHIDIAQTLTGGISGTTEKRELGWNVREHTDHIFGSVRGQTRFIGSKKDGSKTVPDLEIQTKVGKEEEDAGVAKFFNGDVLADGSASDGWAVDESEGSEPFLQSWVESVDNGWTAEQVWGFEVINGARYYTRRIVVAKNGVCSKVRLVYGYIGQEE
ncbi:hypothetical protein TMEN_2520 [Trichophyton mentagrophytes]|uniref:Metallo-beta-lactamase family protein n=3 Tax=Trichophyton TaxID=5550 RepID=A0A9P4YIU1_9EURO|nr:hypothetical protein TESG_07577 [Trichophyton tonsurans CBS 112818]EZF33953.1 hypothetical protein H101_02497 [Trichophyton interdigitale H6]KAF3897940.1 Metallo-beta-lactamase family protein [Trichophyton interdigitale]KDB27470.1 hypothetical protein H109_00733 [Trichophyton interdigitale MR816]GBF60116.1 hypothetical protein TMEN_2520 [Trichophyton mentagrophytes]